MDRLSLGRFLLAFLVRVQLAADMRSRLPPTVYTGRSIQLRTREQRRIQSLAFGELIDTGWTRHGA